MSPQPNTVAEPTTIHFPEGIPGFEKLTEYCLSHSDTDAGRIYRLAAADDAGVIFTLVDPRFYSLNYTLELTDDEQALLEANQPEDITVLLMLWTQDDSEAAGTAAINANIAGPILLNLKSQRGMQKPIANAWLALNISN